MTQQQQIEQEARERFPTPDYLNEDQRSWMELAQQAYIAGATEYAPVWRKIGQYVTPTVPKRVLLSIPNWGEPVKGHKQSDGTWYSVDMQCLVRPTHYMPLPELPNQP